MDNKINFILNEIPVVSNSSPNTRLLDVLREEFNLTGSKEGCGEGECGACSVIIDGELANSCLIAVGSIKNQNVLTIDGFSKTNRFKVLQECYAKAGAVQCGFCIPGMIMASEALLSHNPNPTEEEIRKGISGNLCRCTGYNMIVEAIEMAAKEGGGLW